MKRLLSLLLLILAVRAAHGAPAATLEAKVKALVGKSHAGVAIVHVEGGETVLVDGHRLYPLASVFKLPILIELARRMQAGTMKLDQTLPLRDEDKIIGSGTLRNRPSGSQVRVGEAIELMETISDNTATDLLFNHIGLDSVNRMMSGYGFRETDIYLTNRAAWLISLGMGTPFKGLSARAIAAKWLALSPAERKKAAAQVVAENRKTSLAAIQRAEDASNARPYADDMYLAAVLDNLASPYDLAQLLVQLQQRKLLDGRWTEYCLGVLGRQKFNSRIPRHLPAGTRTFHKTGTIRGVVNDAGIVEIGPQNHVVVVVLVRDVGRGGNAAAEELIGRISRAAYDAFR